MRTLFLVALLGLAACAKKDGTPGETPVCTTDPGAEQITYADGVTRKSNVTSCKYASGKVCTYATFVNDPSVTFAGCQ